MKTSIQVTKLPDRTLKVAIDSECEMVRDLGMHVEAVRAESVLARWSESEIHRHASRCIKHAACPVPMAVLKAIEVEAGLAVPRDVTVRFVSDNRS
jgi:hypothetical protein